MELFNIASGFMDSQSRAIREGYQRVLDGLGFVSKGGAISESKKLLNAFNLTESVGVFNLKKPHTRLFGNATEVDVGKQATAGDDCYIDGVAFLAGDKMSDTPLIKISAPGRAVITNCLFHRGSSGGSASFVEVEDGATAIIMGSAFLGTSAVANAVLHAGGAGNVQIVACSGRNVTAFGANTTVTASLL
jgi:hypothetical protein|tara:strand:- start:3389 stop:3958 length:570 start_codon:yes stop_codon:yes gene_type:complete